jgi:glyoxylase-like metal-dependent hydrolase (beta-lactamase superfamily II)/8-oxo-dGTP pyrophosphatase MutT (NUDIX family)
VFLVRRAEHLRFFGGFWAFPGGKVSPEDADVPVTPAGLSARVAVRRATAARELFEETGVLLAHRADGSFPPASSVLAQFRRDMMAGRLSFAAILRQLDVTVHAEDLVPIGDITTPAFVPFRFDTTFFVAHLPPVQQADVWPGELAQGEWSTAAALLERWTRGACLVSPPTVMTLEAIRDRLVDEAPARLGPLLQRIADGAIHPIFFAPEVQLLPLETVALAPGAHTNAYLVGRASAYLLDPGPTEPAEQQRLLDALEVEHRAGRHLAAIVLTHHHPDHIGAVTACAERYGVPVWAHPWTAARLRGRIEVAREIQDGDLLDLGPRPDGTGPWQLQALHTPGHAPGHLAFYDPYYKLLFVGDMVSTLSSVVIAPPEGELAVYLQSLQKLRTYDCRLLLPGHGNASAQPRETLDACLRHRVKREEQLLAALAGARRTIADLGPELYGELPANLMHFARLQLLAGLQKLEREGRVEALGEGMDGIWKLRHAGSEMAPPA